MKRLLFTAVALLLTASAPKPLVRRWKRRMRRCSRTSRVTCETPCATPCDSPVKCAKDQGSCNRDGRQNLRFLL